MDSRLCDNLGNFFNKLWKNKNCQQGFQTF